MKKPIILLALLLSVIICQAQDPCKGITKEVKELQGRVSYFTPFILSPVRVSISKIFVNGTSLFLATFGIYHNYADYNAHGLYIKFSDGSIIKDEDVKADCTYEGHEGYYYFSYIKLTDDNIDKFKTLSIVKYGISDMERDVNDKSGDRIKGWINCLSSKTE